MNILKGVACLGDSITYTNSARSAVSFPLQLELMLGPAWYVANAGVGGNRSDQILSRWTTAIRSRGYQVLALQGGINDIVQEYPSAETSGETAAGQVLQIANEALDDGLHVVLMNLLPMGNYSGWNSMRQSQMEVFNAAIAAYVPPEGMSARYQLLDLYQEFTAGGENPHDMHPDYDSGDGLHPGAAGVTRMAELVYERVKGAV